MQQIHNQCHFQEFHWRESVPSSASLRNVVIGKYIFFFIFSVFYLSYLCNLMNLLVCASSCRMIIKAASYAVDSNPSNHCELEGDDVRTDAEQKNENRQPLSISPFPSRLGYFLPVSANKGCYQEATKIMFNCYIFFGVSVGILQIATNSSINSNNTFILLQKHYKNSNMNYDP